MFYILAILLLAAAFFAIDYFLGKVKVVIAVVINKIVNDEKFGLVIDFEPYDFLRVNGFIFANTRTGDKVFLFAKEGRFTKITYGIKI